MEAEELEQEREQVFALLPLGMPTDLTSLRKRCNTLGLGSKLSPQPEIGVVVPALE